MLGHDAFVAQLFDILSVGLVLEDVVVCAAHSKHPEIDRKDLADSLKAAPGLERQRTVPAFHEDDPTMAGLVQIQTCRSDGHV